MFGREVAGLVDMSTATLVSSERLVNPKTIPCRKCYGTGIVGYVYAGGRCFACGGSGRRRDRSCVVREVRHTFFVPEGMDINLEVNTNDRSAAPQESAPVAAPEQGDSHRGGAQCIEAPRSPCYPHLVGLPWSEQLRIRALQRDL
jgi:hypothetical protein